MNSRQAKMHELDGVMSKAFADHLRASMVACLGCLLVAYAFNLGDVKTWLNAYMSGLDQSAKSHGTEVSRYFAVAFPYLAGALGMLFARILGGELLKSISGLFRVKKPKSKPKCILSPRQQSLRGLSLKLLGN